MAEADATVTAAPEAPVAVLEETLKALRSELEDKESQWLVALLAGGPIIIYIQYIYIIYIFNKLTVNLLC